jgi:hypothetical protein
VRKCFGGAARRAGSAVKLPTLATRFQSAHWAWQFQIFDLSHPFIFGGSAAGMSRQTLLLSASTKIDAEIARVQNEIKSLDRSILAQQQQRSVLSANLDALLASKEKSDMSTPPLRFACPPNDNPPLFAILLIYFLTNQHEQIFLTTPIFCRDEISTRINGEREWADPRGFPWSSTLHTMLRECFRLHSFRPGQLEAINCVSYP